MDHEGDYFFLNYSLGNLLLVNRVNVFDTWPDHMSVWVIAGSLRNHRACAKGGEDLARCSALPNGVRKKGCPGLEVFQPMGHQGSDIRWSLPGQLKTDTYCALCHICMLPPEQRATESGRKNSGLDRYVLLQQLQPTQNPTSRVKMVLSTKLLFFFLKQVILPSARVGITTVVTCHIFRNTDL